MKRKKRIFLFLLAGLLLFGCAPAAGQKGQDIKIFDVGITVPADLELVKDDQDHRAKLNAKDGAGKIIEDAGVYLVCATNESTLDISAQDYVALEGNAKKQTDEYTTAFTEVNILKEGEDKIKDIPVLRTRFEGVSQGGVAYVRDVVEFVYKNREYAFVISYPKDDTAKIGEGLDGVLATMTFN